LKPSLLWDRKGCNSTDELPDHEFGVKDKNGWLENRKKLNETEKHYGI